MRKLLDFVKSAEHVTRFHTVHTLQDNSVAAHSFGVAWFCYLILKEECSRELLLAALSHDLAESYYGDMPSPTKKEFSSLVDISSLEDELLKEHELAFSLSELEKKVLKVADLLDGLSFCASEVAIGNNSISLKSCLFNFHAYIRKFLEETEFPSYEIYKTVRDLTDCIVKDISYVSE